MWEDERALREISILGKSSEKLENNKGNSKLLICLGTTVKHVL